MHQIIWNMGWRHMFPATVGPVYWKMITYCVPNDKSAQWHVALLSWPDPSLIVSVVSFLCTTLALICRNDRPHMRGTNRIPSASLSLSSLRPPRCHLHPLHPLSSSLQPVAPGESKTWFKPRTLGFLSAGGVTSPQRERAVHLLQVAL